MEAQTNAERIHRGRRRSRLCTVVRHCCFVRLSMRHAGDRNEQQLTANHEQRIATGNTSEVFPRGARGLFQYFTTRTINVIPRFPDKRTNFPTLVRVTFSSTSPYLFHTSYTLPLSLSPTALVQRIMLVAIPLTRHRSINIARCKWILYIRIYISRVMNIGHGLLSSNFVRLLRRYNIARMHRQLSWANYYKLICDHIAIECCRRQITTNYAGWKAQRRNTSNSDVSERLDANLAERRGE